MQRQVQLYGTATTSRPEVEKGKTAARLLIANAVKTNINTKYMEWPCFGHYVLFSKMPSPILITISGTSNTRKHISRIISDFIEVPVQSRGMLSRKKGWRTKCNVRWTVSKILSADNECLPCTKLQMFRMHEKLNIHR